MARVTRTLSPAEAWSELKEGNARFVRGEMAHPSQGIADRAELSAAQYPFAVLFGCSDSRVASEIIFDQGLGDLFVVRTAGHVIDTTVLGSIEYGVSVLGAPLVVVLGHASCGAVAAATAALTSGDMPSGFVRAVVDRVIPSIVGLSSGGSVAGLDAAALGREHVRNTVRMLQSYSVSLAEGIAAGKCGIVGLEYDLADGEIELIESVGQID